MWIVVAGISGALAVALGAYGAHGLAARLAAAQVDSWKTAAHYHLLHSVVILALALYSRASQRPVGVAASLFVAGIVLFSGSIYTLVLGGPRWLGPVTPVGGLLLMAGWVSLLVLARAP